MLDLIVTGEIPFDFNKKTKRVNIQMDWNGRLDVNDYIVFEAFRIVDPEVYSKVYSDQWLKEYTTALFKMQWGNNLTKYGNYTLPGGLVVNGEKFIMMHCLKSRNLKKNSETRTNHPHQCLLDN